MTYTATLTTKGQVTIPIEIRKFLDLAPFQRLAFVKRKKEVVVKPVVDFMSLKGTVKGRKYFDKKADQAVGKLVAKTYGQKN